MGMKLRCGRSLFAAPKDSVVSNPKHRERTPYSLIALRGRADSGVSAYPHTALPWSRVLGCMLWQGVVPNHH